MDFHHHHDRHDRHPHHRHPLHQRPTFSNDMDFHLGSRSRARLAPVCVTGVPLNSLNLMMIIIISVAIIIMIIIIVVIIMIGWLP